MVFRCLTFTWLALKPALRADRQEHVTNLYQSFPKIVICYTSIRLSLTDYVGSIKQAEDKHNKTL